MSRAGRRIARILRHEPELVGLTLGVGGWVDVAALIKACRETGMPLSVKGLNAIVAEDDKQRFTLSEDGRRIRAAQGHSVGVELGYEALEPPEVLFHGTATKSLGRIFREGIRSQRRRYVHLSLDPETATKVGTRHGTPIILEVQAGEMHRAGQAFFRAENGVWLTEVVPVGRFHLR